MKSHFKKNKKPKYEFLRWSCSYLIEALGCYIDGKTCIVSAVVTGIELCINSLMAVNTFNIYSLIKTGTNIFQGIFKMISNYY